MYFKNKNTGITWHITDKSHQKRLQADKNYSTVSIAKKTDLKSIDWQELRKLATEKGINTHGKSREVIEQELSEVADEDGNDQED